MINTNKPYLVQTGQREEHDETLSQRLILENNVLITSVKCLHANKIMLTRFLAIRCGENKESGINQLIRQIF